MAVTNHERVGKGLELLRAGLGPFVERELKLAVHAGNLDRVPPQGERDDPMFRRPSAEWDVAVVLRLIWGQLARCVRRDSWALGSQSGERAA